MDLQRLEERTEGVGEESVGELGRGGGKAEMREGAGQAVGNVGRRGNRRVESSGVALGG